MAVAMEMEMEMEMEWQDQSTDKYESMYSFCVPISGPRFMSLDIWTRHSARRAPTKSDAPSISAYGQDAPYKNRTPIVLVQVVEMRFKVVGGSIGPFLSSTTPGNDVGCAPLKNTHPK